MIYLKVNLFMVLFLYYIEQKRIDCIVNNYYDYIDYTVNKVEFRGGICVFAIEIKNLTKDYGKNRAIKDISLNINQGEFFGFIGPNGAGKSTAIKSLLNFIYPTSGYAKIFDLDCVKESKQIKESVGYVPGEVNYYKNMKVKDLLKYALSFKGNGNCERLEELCEIFEVDTEKLVSDLSLGNKKKIAIIQALLNSPKLLILDEPTNGLDPLMQKKLFEVLVEENKKGTTIFFSSHNLNEIQKFCHRVAIIKEGTIIDIKDIDKSIASNEVKIIINTNDNIDKLLSHENVSNISKENNKTSFIYSGNINSIIKELGNINIDDLKITELNLEETFMTYYEKEGK